MNEILHFEREGGLAERIEGGVWRPGVLAQFERSVGAGMSTKKFKEQIGAAGGVRITGKRERFEKKFAEQTSEERVPRIAAGRILARLLHELDPDADTHDIAKTALTHGDTIVNVTREYLEKDRNDLAKVAADGLITNLEHVPLMVAAADCAPVGVYDDGGDGRRKAIGLFHSGWRGTLQQIISAGISEMKAKLGSVPETLRVFIGPYGGKEDYEVGRDVYEKFKSAARDGALIYSPEELAQIFKPNPAKPNASYFFDNGRAIKIAAMKAGVPEHQIEVSGHSTMQENEVFSSERIEGSEQRDSNIVLLVLKSERSS